MCVFTSSNDFQLDEDPDGQIRRDGIWNIAAGGANSIL